MMPTVQTEAVRTQDISSISPSARIEPEVHLGRSTHTPEEVYLFRARHCRGCRPGGGEPIGRQKLAFSAVWGAPSLCLPKPCVARKIDSLHGAV